MDWTSCYSAEALQHADNNVEFIDVGCGYGGLLSALFYTFGTCFILFLIPNVTVGLSTAYPQSLALGMEIRVKVSDYVQERITALRAQAKAENSGMKDVRTFI